MARKQHPHGRKRRQPAAVEIDGQAEMDDMAVAASYAALVYTNPVKPLTAEASTSAANDDNEIELAEEEEDVAIETETENVGEDAPTVVDSESSESDSSDDDDNDDNDDSSDDDDTDTNTKGNDNKIDMKKERAEIDRMQKKKSVHDEHDKEALVAPKTENELDPYQTPLSELEQTFHLKLTVEEHDKLKLNSSAVDGNNNSQDEKIKLCQAGKIKSHMVQDRTIIVESCPRDGSVAPLDEGSLLVFRMTLDDDSSNNTGSSKTPIQSLLVPIGKVFEVFGPVRRPLYTLRLPAKEKPKNSANNKSKEAKPQSSTKGDAMDAEKTQIPQLPDNAPVNEALPQETQAAESKGASETIRTTADALEESTDGASEPDVPAQKSEEATTVEPNADAQKKEQQKKTVPEEKDPWSGDGKYTMFLFNNPDLIIYYVEDDAKLIDAEALLRMSARGCGTFTFPLWTGTRLPTRRPKRDID